MIEIEPSNIERKIKVLVLSDHPMSPSGVGTQTKNVLESLLPTGKYKFICLGGAVKHSDYTPVKIEEWGEDLIIYPVDGYGTQDMIRSLMRTERPDIIWIMTDPRFWGWFWEIEDEIRPQVPIVYYHVWDNYPYPHFNRPYYRSNDVIVSISKVTDDIVRTVVPEMKCVYIPHAVDPEIFNIKSDDEVLQLRKQYLGHLCDWDTEKRFIFFWNNRNARRKMSGSVLWWFKEFLDEVGHDKAALIMHTDPKDPHGQDLEYIADSCKLDKGQIILSGEKVSPNVLARLYNISDCTINISDAEGFGLATLESLSCGTPILVNKTGGLQEQITDGADTFGIGLEPSSKAVIGSQAVPFIYEDRVSKSDFIDALKKMISFSEDELRELGVKGRVHVEKNYNFENFKTQWQKLMLDVYEEFGSWENRKKYKSWELLEF